MTRGNCKSFFWANFSCSDFMARLLSCTPVRISNPAIKKDPQVAKKELLLCVVMENVWNVMSEATLIDQFSNNYHLHLKDSMGLLLCFFRRHWPDGGRKIYICHFKSFVPVIGRNFNLLSILKVGIIYLAGAAESRGRWKKRMRAKNKSASSWAQVLNSDNIKVWRLTAQHNVWMVF